MKNTLAAIPERYRHLVRFTPLELTHTAELPPDMQQRFDQVVEIYEAIRRKTGDDYTFQFPAIRALSLALDHFDGALDAADTGIGKTAVACAVAKLLDRTIFVICPKNVIPPWKRMAKLFGVRCVVVNYEMLRTGKTPFGQWESRGDKAKWKFHFDISPDGGNLFVFDECHRMKDYKTLNCKVGVAAIEGGYKVLALSATAADNPMHMKFVALLTGLIASPSHFYGWMLEHGVRRGRFGLEFTGSRKILSQIHRKIFPAHGSRIRIADLGDRFPQTQIISEPYQVANPKEIDRIYREMREEIQRLREAKSQDKGANVLTTLLRARQEVELLKVPTFVQMAEDGLAEGMSVVVILNFTASIEAKLWGSKLHNRAANLITGATDTLVRQELIDSFNEDKTDFLLMNIKAGGLGISLHGTTTSRTRLVIISPTFSGIDLKQALGRCHRAGGAHSIQKIVWAAGTVEEKACEKVRARLQRVSIFNDDQLDDSLAI
jgi:superfamily II DNA or RNA helicase